MTVANRVQVAVVREDTIGTTPTTPRMRLARITGESLSFSPEYVDSAEIRSDRMLGDPIKVMQASGGGLNFEVSYPDDLSPLSEIYRSAFYNAWDNTAQRLNDGTADSVITNVVASTDTFTVTDTGDDFVVGQLVYAGGFTNSGNNQVFKAAATSSGVAVVAPASPGLTDEAAPPATAMLKVVGFEGASGDITALADGLGSTALDFTTLGLIVGQWVKVGGTADATQFAFLVTAGANARSAAFARITAIAATKLTLDNLPTGWTTDSGTGKTIKVWVGDQIKNGITKSSVSIERGYLGQTIPSYIINTGMVAGTLSHSISSRQVMTGTATFMGMGGSVSTTALDASPEAVTLGRVMAANANVGRIAENGTRLTSPNWARELTWNINNNTRTVEAADEASPVDINEGECTVTLTINTYFGDTTLLQKFYNGTPTQVNSRIAKDGQALIWQFPRVTYRGGGNPNATAKNTDVMLNLDGQASKDTILGCHVALDRFFYYE